MRNALLARGLVMYATLLDKGGRAGTMAGLRVIRLVVTTGGRLESHCGAGCLTGGRRFGRQSRSVHFARIRKACLV